MSVRAPEHSIKDEGFQPEDLDHIEAAFKGIWAAVEVNLKTRDHAKDQELKREIMKRLLAMGKRGTGASVLIDGLAAETIARLNDIGG